MDNIQDVHIRLKTRTRWIRYEVNGALAFDLNFPKPHFIAGVYRYRNNAALYGISMKAANSVQLGFTEFENISSNAWNQHQSIDADWIEEQYCMPAGKRHFNLNAIAPNIASGDKIWFLIFEF